MKKIPRNNTSIFLRPVSKVEVGNILNSLKNKNGSGYDGISNVLLKKIKSALVAPLTIIFNKSITESKFLDAMKHAEVFPMHKAKEIFYLNNYRPISLLITLSKCLEKVLHSRISEHLERHCMFYARQYGFRKNHSTIDASTDLLGTILKNSENKKVTGCMFIDLSKSFGTIDHHILFEKLDMYGIGGNCLEWVKSYLNNRTLCAKVTSSGSLIKSENFVVEVSTPPPQGSILGPLFFSIFVNEINYMLTNLECILYADDTTSIATGKSSQEIENILNDQLNIVVDWLQFNKLSINLGKCNVIWKSK